MDSQEIILDHYHHPRHSGRLKNPTHSGETKNISCGDSLAMDIKVENGIIKEIGWTGSGCALSQASASILSEIVNGMPINDAISVGKEEIFDALEAKNLSPARTKCALLSLETLHRTLEVINS